jgi:hypothetical protein
MGKGKGGARTPSNTYILAAHSLGINPCDALPRDIGPKDAGQVHPTVHDATPAPSHDNRMRTPCPNCGKRLCTSAANFGPSGSWGGPAKAGRSPAVRGASPSCPATRRAPGPARSAEQPSLSPRLRVRCGQAAATLSLLLYPRPPLLLQARPLLLDPILRLLPPLVHLVLGALAYLALPRARPRPEHRDDDAHDEYGDPSLHAPPSRCTFAAFPLPRVPKTPRPPRARGKDPKFPRPPPLR